jgi:hypothetical protein
MNWRKRTIMELAREAGAHDNGHEVRFVEPKYLERFAALVREEALAQPEERNFCPRCGKRTRDLTHIHTCTPPQDEIPKA